MVLGLEADDTVPSRLYFHCGDVIVAVIDWEVEPLGPFQPTPENLYFATDELDAVHERATARSASALSDREAPMGRTIVLLHRSRRQSALLRR
jgi:hypothetical protein